MSPTELRIHDFVVTTFYVPDDMRLSPDTLLVQSGIVDSTGILEVLDFIEADFGVVVTDAEMLPENLQSVACIARFVERKTARRPVRAERSLVGSEG